MDVMSALHRLEGSCQFDIIFMDPPYGQELEKAVLYYLASSGMVHEDTLIVVEASNDTAFDYITDDKSLSMDIIKCKRYKTNSHFFIQKRGVEGGTK